MGFGASLAFIAIGAILAFATRFSVSGIDVQMIGWILMAVGVVGMIITFTYIRPRRRRGLAQVEVVDEEPAYIAHADEETPPHVHTRREVVEERPVPGRYLGDKLG
jgi:flagellar biosynthesis/type III secretory pathway M-ring protein FliF/YscJ